MHSCLVYNPFNIHQHSKNCLKNLKRRVGILPTAFPTAARSCFLQLLWSHYTQRYILLKLFFHQLLRTNAVLLQKCRCVELIFFLMILKFPYKKHTKNMIQTKNIFKRSPNALSNIALDFLIIVFWIKGQYKSSRRAHRVSFLSSLTCDVRIAFHESESKKTQKC